MYRTYPIYIFLLAISLSFFGCISTALSIGGQIAGSAGIVAGEEIGEALFEDGVSVRNLNVKKRK